MTTPEMGIAHFPDGEETASILGEEDELPFPKEVKKKGKGSESQNNRTKNPRTKTDERISKSRNKRPPKKSKNNPKQSKHGFGPKLQRS